MHSSTERALWRCCGTSAFPREWFWGPKCFLREGGDEGENWGNVLKLPIWDLSPCSVTECPCLGISCEPGAGAAPCSCSVLSSVPLLGQQQLLPVVFEAQPEQFPGVLPFPAVRFSTGLQQVLCSASAASPHLRFCFSTTSANDFSAPCLVLLASSGPEEPPRLFLELEQT